MIDILLQEPVMNLVQQWPVLALSVVVMWGIRDAMLKLRDDLRDCIKHSSDLTDRLLEIATSQQKSRSD